MFVGTNIPAIFHFWHSEACGGVKVTLQVPTMDERVRSALAAWRDATNDSLGGSSESVPVVTLEGSPSKLERILSKLTPSTPAHATTARESAVPCLASSYQPPPPLGCIQLQGAVVAHLIRKIFGCVFGEGM
jgi:hypothetical protein